ncbi:sensor histidine kinase [Bdellovibrio sp. HCB337]|uniref:sensor histidine kinase n=1 Tax=Bdellovibrio sp. HCB337 TaxID=3394358 RepID=UPI0039A4548D
MANINLKKINWSMERKALVAFSIIFVAVVGSAWIYAMKLRQTVVANNSITMMDSSALVEVERLRNIADSQIANSKAFFLLGAKSIFDLQEKEKDELMKSLASFEKEYSLPQIPAIIKRIESIELKNKEFFDQAMDFREKKTESKIVGQFFQSKAGPLRAQLNDAFDEISSLHKAEIDRVNAQARGSVVSIESDIPKGMAWLTSSIALIFLGLSFLVIRLLRERPAHLAERNRLYNEAIKAVQSRDEAIFAVSHDLNESLTAIKSTAERLETTGQSEVVKESAELVKGNVQVIEGLIKDIRDQKSSEMEGLILRLDQLGIDEVLESARLLMQPMAKQRDVRIQVDTVNPPVLAFYDRERVLRVLSNLIGNAIKASPKGGKVVVKVRSDQKFVNISVLDNGTGIPDSQLEGIFDNFWQARKTADQGAGIGLAIVKTTVEAHGGTVQVQSQSGRGSTFTFSLPRRRPVGAPVRKLAPAVRSSATSHLDFQDGPNL